MTLNDDNLAYLLSLGFELELCRQALQQNATLEDATEWILDPSQPPTLTASNIHFSQPIFSSSSFPTPNVSLEKNQKNQKNQKGDQETRDSQKKKVDRIADDLRKERLAEREARRRALLDIKEDRERQKRRMRSQPTAMQTSDTSASTTKPAEVRSSDQFASIQFKLTDSKTLRQRFPPDTKLVTLLKLVMENETSNQHATLENISLISTFPKRIYNMQDAALDMREAGFLPNVTLNVNITEPLEMADMMQIEDKRGSNNGRRLGDENEREGGSDQNANIMDIDAISGVDPHRPPVHSLRRVWGRVGTGHQLTDPSPIVNTLETVVEEADAEDITDIRRSNFLMAIEQRASTSSNTLVNQPQPTLERHVKSLRETCSMSVAGLLSQHSSQINTYLKNLKSLSSEVAESLLGYLIKSGKLNASTVRKLADHCYLENIKLDSYTYCTDSLIGDLARSNSTVSITKLSLRGCDVITDNGIRSITGLKNLGCLDVNNCKVTDNGLKSLENLYHLYHLNLSKTKITDQGIASMVENSKFKTNLEVLLLDGCTRVKSSNTLVPIVNGFENLLQLSLANTGIQQQQSNLNLTRSTKLEQLDLTNTFICDNDLIHIISQIRSLVELKMSGCGNLKRLRLVQFPDREHELDGVLSRFKELPLEHLDLTSFLNVTDDGAQHIADMKSLRYLSLDGTQLTDAGVELLSDLIELEKLYLDRTLITDSGLSRLLGLSKLETLSLCHTEVSNVFLKLLGDFEQTSFTRNLRTLNLAKCVSVTNKGVRHLSGALNLTNLNLDHTGVNKGCLKYLQDLKYLKPVRLQGITDDADQTDNTDIDS
ncbi:hypothetical protein [Parasitella parasitica]|uniref:UBX domain-containing protein n=1 Tax=Parasitella parasitica TaxID=35722 RepID=A0A0B7NC36_9FUNG|nr:hypothetical protein [Parasitella parasitica]